MNERWDWNIEFKAQGTWLYIGKERIIHAYLSDEEVERSLSSLVKMLVVTKPSDLGDGLSRRLQPLRPVAKCQALRYRSRNTTHFHFHAVPFRPLQRCSMTPYSHERWTS